MVSRKPVVPFDLTEGRVSGLVPSIYATADDLVDLGDRIISFVGDPAWRKIVGTSERRRVREKLT
jgi:hypothetical protein